VDERKSPETRESPAQKAEELARLASSTKNPGERVWLLEWARAFRKLASLRERESSDS
jgi:hypothetical protein